TWLTSPARPSRLSYVELPGVDGHADHRIDAQAVEVVYFFSCGDAAGGGDATGGGAADRQDGVAVRASHEAFGIDVRVQKLRTVRLERLHGFHGGQRERRLPAVNHDVTSAAVDGRDEVFGADAARQLLRER